MPHWLYAIERTYFDTGKTEITYSHTPEEFVEEMRRRGERWRVAKRACGGCFYTPEGPLPEGCIRQMDAEAVAYHHTLECVRVSTARFRHEFDTSGNVICYGFYYQHWHENKYLLAAKEAGLIDFCDVSELPDPRDVGVNVHPRLDVNPRW